eukprot:TRINITY_DN1738_c0_g2_i1.p1 TRINITY_DN1738_c0_g2~~TRINITY_DN1738_c0_g2_i1.p1  ORF type:complete len:1078 (+),score=427.55 TRINITY_DN1738_c0_g2_i1:84-3236(+)
MANNGIQYTSGGKMIRKAALPTHEQMKALLPARMSPTGRRSTKEKQQPANGESDNVRVMVRVRPFSETEVRLVEEAGGYMQSVIDMPKPGQVVFLDYMNDYQYKNGYNFDNVFWSCTQQQSAVGYANQTDVFDITGKAALEAAWDGINSCIFAYGQTGSGKTHTMMGDPSQIASDEGCDEELLGVIPRLCRELFNNFEDRKDNSEKLGIRKEVEVEVRFLEIYNEKVRDLLINAHVENCESFKEHSNVKGHTIDPDDLRIREHPFTGPYVHGITVFKPKSYEHIIDLINQGNQERSTASTKLNDRSSRSHAMFRITLTQTSIFVQERVGIGGPKTLTSERRSNMNLVDLAGSENVKRSGAAGTTLVEAQKINLSLTTLRRVIDALIESKSSAVVPYRDSTLTWLLRQDLGGNAKTFMLATVSPHFSNAHETFRTLEYAMRAKSIVNVIKVNEDDTSKLINDLERRISETKQGISAGTASNEELEALHATLADAENAKALLEERYLKIAAEAEQYKEAYLRTREKQVAHAFKNAVVLNLTRARLKAAQEAIESKELELQTHKNEVKASGHKNVNEMAGSLQGHRELVDHLMKEKEEFKEKEEKMKRQEEELRAALEKEKAKLEQEKSAKKDLERKGEYASMKTLELNDTVSSLTERMSDLLKEHEAEKMKIKKHHDDELLAIVKESEQMINDYQAKEDKLNLAMQDIKDKHRRELRSASYDTEYKQKVLQEEIDKIRKELLDEKTEHERTKQQLEDERARVAYEKSEHQKTRDKYQEKMTQMEQDMKDLIEHARQCDKEYTEKVREKEEMQRFFSGVEKKQGEMDAAYEDVVKVLGQLQAAEGIPKEWSLDDVKNMLTMFQAFKKDYKSNKPNKEKLRQMLRADPTRRGAERMRELLSGGISMEYPSPQVIMDGMKCPELPQRRSKSPHHAHYDPEANAPTEADKMPYMSDSPTVTPLYPQSAFGRYPTYTVGRNFAREKSRERSRTPTRVRPISVSPIRLTPTTPPKQMRSPRSAGSPRSPRPGSPRNKISLGGAKAKKATKKTTGGGKN